MLIKDPKITIITCSYNSERYIADCIESVNSQTYKNIEHIFIDGGSTDSTLQVIKSKSPNARVISEKDNGPYDAFNKGIKMASGDIIGFLHSDDYFVNEKALGRVVAAFSNNNIDYYSSTMRVIDLESNREIAVLGDVPHKPTFREQILRSSYYAHPANYFLKNVFAAVGPFKLNYRIAADIDWLIRMEKLGLKFVFEPEPLLNFRASGVSSKHMLRGSVEEFKIRIKHNGFTISLCIATVFHLVRRIIKITFTVCGFKNIIWVSRKFLKYR